MAGTSPNATPVTNATKAVKMSTLPSIVIVSTAGIVGSSLVGKALATVPVSTYVLGMWMATLPVGAIAKVMKQVGWQAGDVDLFEINEAFAAVPMAAMKDLPWPLTFSYSRALQNPALKAWRGQSGNLAAAQKAFHHRAHMNGLAATGKWRAELEKQAA